MRVEQRQKYSDDRWNDVLKKSIFENTEKVFFSLQRVE